MRTLAEHTLRWSSMLFFDLLTCPFTHDESIFIDSLSSTGLFFPPVGKAFSIGCPALARPSTCAKHACGFLEVDKWIFKYASYMWSAWANILPWLHPLCLKEKPSDIDSFSVSCKKKTPPSPAWHVSASCYYCHYFKKVMLFIFYTRARLEQYNRHTITTCARVYPLFRTISVSHISTSRIQAHPFSPSIDIKSCFASCHVPNASSDGSILHFSSQITHTRHTLPHPRLADFANSASAVRESTQTTQPRKSCSPARIVSLSRTIPKPAFYLQPHTQSCDRKILNFNLGKRPRRVLWIIPRAWLWQTKKA